MLADHPSLQLHLQLDYFRSTRAGQQKIRISLQKAKAKALNRTLLYPRATPVRLSCGDCHTLDMCGRVTKCAWQVILPCVSIKQAFTIRILLSDVATRYVGSSAFLFFGPNALCPHGVYKVGRTYDAHEATGLDMASPSTSNYHISYWSYHPTPLCASIYCYVRLEDPCSEGSCSDCYHPRNRN